MERWCHTVYLTDEYANGMISKEDILRLAKLSKLSIADEELEHLTKEMKKNRRFRRSNK